MKRCDSESHISSVTTMAESLLWQLIGGHGLEILLCVEFGAFILSPTPVLFIAFSVYKSNTQALFKILKIPEDVKIKIT